MKKTLLAIVALSCMAAFAADAAHAQLRLDVAIQNSAAELSAAFERGYGVAVLAMRSDSAQMSDHIITEMIVAFMGMQHARGITVVNRMQLNAFAAQHGFDTAGAIDDAAAQSLGALMDVRYVVTGAFEPHVGVFRLDVRVMDVRTASTRSAHIDVQVDGLVASLMSVAYRPTQVVETRATREPRRPREPWEPRGRSLGFGPVFNAASGSTDLAEVSHRSFGGWFFTSGRFFEFSLGVLSGSVYGRGYGWYRMEHHPGWSWGGTWDDDGNFRPWAPAWRADPERVPIFTLNPGFNWRIPFDVHERVTVFPILGLGLDVVIVPELVAYDALDSLRLSSMQFNLGGGADFNITERMFIRAQVIGHYDWFFARLPVFQDHYHEYRYGSPNMFGITPRIGIGFRL